MALPGLFGTAIGQDANGGVLGKSLIKDYTGDGSANRKIDLGDDYDVVMVAPVTDIENNSSHAAFALAIRDQYSLMYEYGAGITMRSKIGSYADAWWKGKVAASNEIDLGTVGANAESTNRAGRTFRIFAMKFSAVQS